MLSLKPRAKKIFFWDADITPLPSFMIGRMCISYVPQDGIFFEDDGDGSLKTGIAGTISQSRLDSVFELFPNIKDRLQREAGSLSVGE